jgi:hypothetical protein
MRRDENTPLEEKLVLLPAACDEVWQPASRPEEGQKQRQGRPCLGNQ